MTAPPHLMCQSLVTSSVATNLQVSVAVNSFTGEPLCPSGNALRQVVLGTDNVNNSNSCAYTAGGQDWKSGIEVPIMATVDLVKDGDVTGSVNVTASVICEGNVEFLLTKTVQVCIFNYF